METHGYTEKEMSDHAFSKWLKEKGWIGKYDMINEWNRFYVGNTIIALVQYKNSSPVKMWIHLKTDLI